MTDDDLNNLVAHIDQLLSEYIEKRSEAATGRVVRGSDIDIEDIIKHGAFSPDDPTTPSARSLLSIGETLGRVGGEALMRQVYDAYEAKYGAKKANSLSARWDHAAGIWHY